MQDIDVCESLQELCQKPATFSASSAVGGFPLLDEPGEIGPLKPQ
jgi:hypothetical protein